MHLRVIGESDVRTLIDGRAALALARATLRDQAAGHSHLSTPSAMTLDARREGGPRLKFKAATVGHLNASGVRLLSRRGGNTGPDACTYTAIYDHRGGALVGLVSELWLSRLRTAAFAVATLEPLVPRRKLTIGLFGTGDIGAEIVPLLALAFDIEIIKVASRRASHACAFAAKFAQELGIPIRAEDEPAAVVAGAGLVITVTEAREPLVRAGMLAPGAVLCSMGSYNEVDYEVLRETDRLVVDDPDYACESGDAAAWIAQGRLIRAEFLARIDAVAAEVVGGIKPGRLTETDRILAIVQGMAIGDIAFAIHVLRAGEAKGRGEIVALP